MSEKNFKKKTYVTLGELKLRKETKEPYIEVNKNVEIVINGMKFTGKYINLNSPADKFKKMAEKGKITADEAAEKIAKIPEFVRKDVVIVLE